MTGTARRESRHLAASTAAALPSSSTLMDTGPNGAGTWNKSHKSTGSSTVFEKRNSAYELHSMADKMSSKTSSFYN